MFHWLNNFKPCNTKVNVFPFNGQRHSTGFILFSLLSTMCVHLVVLFHLLDLNRTDFEASNHSLTWPRIQCCVKIKTCKLFCAILHPSFSFFYFLPIPDCLGDPQYLIAHLPTRVGILLTVGGAELSVRHRYGGGVGYDMLAPGLSYRRLIKIYFTLLKHRIEKFWFISSHCLWGSDSHQQSTWWQRSALECFQVRLLPNLL